MKKRELLITAILLLSAIFLWFGIRFASPRQAASIRITVGGDEFGVFSLAKDRTILIGDTNVCEIQDGKAHMLSASCPDQICVKTKAIRTVGSSIICLPNKVIVEIIAPEGASDADVPDVVVH